MTTTQEIPSKTPFDLFTEKELAKATLAAYRTRFKLEGTNDSKTAQREVDDWYRRSELSLNHTQLFSLYRLVSDVIRDARELQQKLDPEYERLKREASEACDRFYAAGDVSVEWQT